MTKRIFRALFVLGGAGTITAITTAAASAVPLATAKSDRHIKDDIVPVSFAK